MKTHCFCLEKSAVHFYCVDLKFKSGAIEELGQQVDKVVASRVSDGTEENLLIRVSYIKRESSVSRYIAKARQWVPREEDLIGHSSGQSC